jgi:hypothetical protein
MDLGDAAVLGVPQGADQCDDVKAELVLRQCVMALLLGAERGMVARAERVATTPDLEPKPDGALQCGDDAARHVGCPEEPAAGRASSHECGQLEGLLGLRAGTPSGHSCSP